MSTFAEDLARTEFYIRLKAVHPIAACVLIELDQDERVLEARIGPEAMTALGRRRTMDKTIQQLKKRVEDLEAALQLMYEAYAAEHFQRTEVGLGDEEIEHMKGRACQAVEELLPKVTAQYRDPEPEWLNVDDDSSERQIAWYG